MVLNNGLEEVGELQNFKQPEKKYVAYAICWLLGNGSLFAWQSMLTIADYYVHLFPRYHPARVLTLVYQPFALITIAILSYHEARINTRRRILLGYALSCMCSFMILVMDLATSGHGHAGFFFGICIMGGLYGIADLLVQGGMIGELSFMQAEFILSFISGSAASGVIASGLRLVTKAAFQKSKDGLHKGALMFFSVSTSFELSCLLIYAFIFPRLQIVKYYRSKAALEGSKTVEADLVAGGIRLSSHAQDIAEGKIPERLHNKQLLWQNIDYAVDLFLIYSLTVSILPGFLSEDTGKHELGSWYAIILIAMFNCGDLIGRYIPLIKILKLEGRTSITIASIFRFCFIPAFYFAARHADQGWMLMLCIVLGMSNGYLTVIIFTNAPRGYKMTISLGASKPSTTTPLWKMLRPPHSVLPMRWCSSSEL